MHMYAPILVIVLSNIFYNVCSKSTPADISPFASLTVTYAIGAVVSGVLFFVLNRHGSLLAEYRHLNWTAFVLGFAIVGLEAGSIAMYKAGWAISTGQIVYSSLLVICLIAVGRIFYHEPLTLNRIAGVLICLAGMYVINRG